MLLRLRQTLDDADVPRREVEIRAGFSPGYLAQLFGENIELKMSHVLAILMAIGREPAAFFRSLHPTGSAAEPLRLPSNQDVASVYGFGIESLATLRQRLERFEDALSNVPGAEPGDEE